MMACRTVLEGAGAGGIAGNRPTNRRLLFARRVRREKQSGGSGSAFDLTNESAGTRSDGLRTRIQTDFCHGAKGEKYPAVCYRGGGRARLRSRARDRNSVSRRLLNDFDDFVDRIRAGDEVGHHMKTGCVRLIRLSHAPVVAYTDTHAGLKQTTAAEETSARLRSDSRIDSLTSPSTETAARAWPPCASLAWWYSAMFTPASPSSVPTRPMTPGTSLLVRIRS